MEQKFSRKFKIDLILLNFFFSIKSLKKNNGPPPSVRYVFYEFYVI